MIYIILLKFVFQSTKSNFYKTRSESCVIKGAWGQSLNRVILAGGVPLVVCSLRTNVGVY